MEEGEGLEPSCLMAWPGFRNRLPPDRRHLPYSFLLRLPSPFLSGEVDGSRTRITDATSRRVGRYTTTPLRWWSRRASNPDPVGASHGRCRYATAPHPFCAARRQAQKNPAKPGCPQSDEIRGYPATGATPRTGRDTHDRASRLAHCSFDLVSTSFRSLLRVSISSSNTRALDRRLPVPCHAQSIRRWMTTNGFKKNSQSLDSMKPFATIPRYSLNEEDREANVERSKPCPGGQRPLGEVLSRQRESLPGSTSEGFFVFS